MNKLIEIDVLKLVLLDEDQMNLFEKIPKPVISIEDEGAEKMLNLHQKLSQKFSMVNNSSKINHNAFHIVYSKKGKTKLDEKLLEMTQKKNGKKKEEFEFFKFPSRDFSKVNLTRNSKIENLLKK